MSLFLAVKRHYDLNYIPLTIYLQSSPSPLLWYRIICQKVILNTVTMSAILDVITGAHFSSWSSMVFRHSKITSVYWGSFRELAVIFQLLASVTQFSGLPLAGMIPEDGGKLESSLSPNSLPLLSAIHTPMIFIFPLFPFLLDPGHIFSSHKTRLSSSSPIMRVIQTENEFDGQMNTMIFIYYCSCSVKMPCALHFEWSMLCIQDLFKVKDGYYRCTRRAAYLYAALVLLFTV